jgi:hypothetical protein
MAISKHEMRHSFLMTPLNHSPKVPLTSSVTTPFSVKPSTKLAAVPLATAATISIASRTAVGRKSTAVDSRSDVVGVAVAFKVENKLDGCEYRGSNHEEWKSKSDTTRIARSREQ